MLSITASSFSQNALTNTPFTIQLSPYVQDSDPAATLDYKLVSATTPDGALVSVDAATGLVSYAPGSSSTSPDSLQYFVTDSDGDMSATETVTLNLSSVAASPVAVSEVEGQSTIDLTILNLPGAIQDVSQQAELHFFERPGRDQWRRHCQLRRHERRHIHVHPAGLDFHRRCDDLLPDLRRDRDEQLDRGARHRADRRRPCHLGYPRRARTQRLPSTTVPSLLDRDS